MKNKELFDRSVSVLTKAYMNGTLQHGDPCGCAVGNLVVSAMNINPDKTILSWCNVFCSNPMPVNSITGELASIGSADTPMTMKQDMHMESYYGAAKEEIDSTGYSLFQLAAIEKAFESKRLYGATRLEWMTENYTEEQEEQAMFDGLCAVYDLLCQIHQVTEEDAVPSAQVAFAK